ncbi:MAG: hypothetical protein II945_09370 [Bacteroidales bacterium]|nr:hypothetical protein [Bacteroidales bacterium]
MKRFFIILLVVLGVPIASYAQVNNDTVNTEQTRLDSIKTQKEIDSLWAIWHREYDSIIKAEQEARESYAKEMQEATKFLPRYKMYQTENIHILLKLDTKRGKVWMVQYGLNDTKSAVIPVEYSYLVSASEGWNGRFELYPTKNVYNFIMVDNYDGETYQVQWSISSSNRFILRITNY